jgi:dTDP-4-dehydrorhamnose 3,5-epimerase-like enzyme
MNIELIDLPKIEDVRGNISVIEKNILPYKIERVYYLYDVPSSAARGGHAHKEQFEFLIPISGSFDVVLNDTKEKRTVTLNKPNKGLLIKSNVWRELENFSSGSVCLVISSGEYEEEDYIREFDEFEAYVEANS